MRCSQDGRAPVLMERHDGGLTTDAQSLDRSLLKSLEQAEKVLFDLDREIFR